MDMATFVPLVLKASIVLTVIALRLDANVEDVLAILRRPCLLMRSLLAMDLFMPVVAVALAYAFARNPVVKIALVALALSPVPPVLPRRQFRAGGRASYVHGLFMFAGLAAILFVPAALEVVERVFDVPLQLAVAVVAKIVLITVVGPLAIGMAIRKLMLGVAEATVSLVGNGTLAAFGGFVMVGLAAGHLLGGPDPKVRREP